MENERKKVTLTGIFLLAAIIVIIAMGCYIGLLLNNQKEMNNKIEELTNKVNELENENELISEENNKKSNSNVIDENTEESNYYFNPDKIENNNDGTYTFYGFLYEENYKIAKDDLDEMISTGNVRLDEFIIGNTKYEASNNYTIKENADDRNYYDIYFKDTSKLLGRIEKDERILRSDSIPSIYKKTNQYKEVKVSENTLVCDEMYEEESQKDAKTVKEYFSVGTQNKIQKLKFKYENNECIKILYLFDTY